MKRKSNLLGQLKASAPRSRKWEALLSTEMRAELDEVKAAFLAGDIKHSIREIYEAARLRFAFTISYWTFKEYFKR